MTCDDARGWIVDRVEGQIDAEHDAALAEHLRGCADCAAREAEERWATVRLRGAFDAAIPAVRRPARRRGWLAVAAAAAIAFLAGRALSRPAVGEAQLADLERLVAAALDRDEEIVGYRRVVERDGVTEVTELRQRLNGRVLWSRETRRGGESERVERWGRDIAELAARFPEAAAVMEEAMPLAAYDPSAPFAERIRQLAARSVSRRAASAAEARERMAGWRGADGSPAERWRQLVALSPATD